MHEAAVRTSCSEGCLPECNLIALRAMASPVIGPLVQDSPSGYESEQRLEYHCDYHNVSDAFPLSTFPEYDDYNHSCPSKVLQTGAMTAVERARRNENAKLANPLAKFSHTMLEEKGRGNTHKNIKSAMKRIHAHLPRAPSWPKIRQNMRLLPD